MICFIPRISAYTEETNKAIVHDKFPGDITQRETRTGSVIVYVCIRCSIVYYILHVDLTG